GVRLGGTTVPVGGRGPRPHRAARTVRGRGRRSPCRAAAYRFRTRGGTTPSGGARRGGRHGAGTGLTPCVSWEGPGFPALPGPRPRHRGPAPSGAAPGPLGERRKRSRRSRCCSSPRPRVKGPRGSVPADGADHRVEGHGALDRAAGHLGDDNVGAPPPRRGDLFDAGQHPHVLRPTDTVLEVADVVTDQQQRAAGPGGTTGTFQDALHL